MRNQFVPPPRIVDPFDGRVASQAGFQSLVITSPNQDYVPEYPIERRIIKTYSDGLWGVNEYSRWPQELVTGMWHIACIPRRGAYGLPEVLWRNLRPAEDWYEDRRAGVLCLGYLHHSIIDDLNAAVGSAVTAFRAIPGLTPARKALGDQLCLMVRLCATRMTRLPAKPGVAVAVAAHVQRLCLELAGLRIYLQDVARRIESPQDFSQQVLPVLGTFVHEGTAAQTCTRVGLPTWFLQPLTAHIKVWRVVRHQSPFDLSAQESQTRIYHTPSVRAGVMNLTGNWLSTMIQGVSIQLCSSTPLSLPTAETEPGAAGEPEAKRARAMHVPVVSKVLDMPVAPVLRPGEPSGKTKKKPRARGGRKHKARDPGATASASAAPMASAEADLTRPSGSAQPRPTPPSPPMPSLAYYRSPFFALADPWKKALRHVGPLPQPVKSAVYFYPPPFLLDTFCPETPLPDHPVPQDAIRPDTKVHRYLHNLVRIRHFCRLRLFDATIPGEPLTIQQWREALWGDYRYREIPKITGGEAETRRTKRKYDEKNAMTHLFGGVGGIRVYSEDDKPKLESLTVTKDVAAKDMRVRYLLLWEAHEINWRCELLALDQVVVPRDGWPELQRWDREGDLSEAWGDGSGKLSILPQLGRDLERFCWASSSFPGWQRCRRPLKAFVDLMARWPRYPDELRRIDPDAEEWSDTEYEEAQTIASRFYAETFVQHFRRLPIVPFAYPSKYKL